MRPGRPHGVVKAGGYLGVNGLLQPVKSSAFVLLKRGDLMINPSCSVTRFPHEVGAQAPTGAIAYCIAFAKT